jgi:hypothetical protein
MSFWTKPTLAANKAVSPPINVTQTNTVGANSNNGDDLIKTNTPAVQYVYSLLLSFSCYYTPYFL